MKYLKILLAFVVLSGIIGAQATPPIEYVVAVRNADGYVMANMPAKFLLDICDKSAGGTVIYSETQAVTTDPSGMAQLMVGEGNPVNGDYDAIDWSAPRFLSVSVDAEGTGNYRSLGTMQLLGVPTARTAKTATQLVRKNAAGESYELTVNNFGELKWTGIEGPTTPNYDQSKVPDKLYFIGTFNSWNVNEAVEMTKLSTTKFTIDRRLSPGEIFKFVPVRKWEGTDWSGTDMKIGEPISLQEFGDTPAFNGTAGDYTITVDFFSFTMLITRK